MAYSDIVQSGRVFRLFGDTIKITMSDAQFDPALNRKLQKETLSDNGLRALRMSFGFWNTIVVLILMKPFHEPILKLKNHMIKAAKNIAALFARSNRRNENKQMDGF